MYDSPATFPVFGVLLVIAVVIGVAAFAGRLIFLKRNVGMIVAPALACLFAVAGYWWVTPVPVVVDERLAEAAEGRSLFSLLAIAAAFLFLKTVSRRYDRPSPPQ